jgi:transcriptional regulator, ArsR family|uniref:transcriptional regulator FilR1 domain-containing protein n=1 Tax=Methanolobus vulcani TaxID=38026 RepID=UPI000AA60639|nr:transcriptional regulator FilR1 domain-containing protein [Methanolobus vulcani]
MIEEADYILGISSIATEEYAECISKKVLEGVTVNIIITPQVAEILKQHPYSEKLNLLHNCDTFKLNSIDKNFKMGLIVTNKCLSLTLARKETGRYDITNGLISFNPKAIRWGERLFEYYNDHL